MGYFHHENLNAYKFMLEAAVDVDGLLRFRGDAWLRDQVLRSTRSAVLNITEERSRGGQAGKNHHRIALGSAAEACAAPDLLGRTAKRVV